VNITLEMNMMAKQFSLNRRAPKNNLLSVAALLFASLMCAQAGPDGHWEADIKGDGPQLMRVTLDLAKNAKSEWIASMGLPSANLGYVMKSATEPCRSLVALQADSRWEPVVLPGFSLVRPISGQPPGRKVVPASRHPYRVVPPCVWAGVSLLASVAPEPSLPSVATSTPMLSPVGFS
jgi:hypothetical protein